MGTPFPMAFSIFHSCAASQGTDDGPIILKFPSLAKGGEAAKRFSLLRPAAIMLGTLVFALIYYRIPGIIGSSGEEVGGWIVAIGSLTAYYLGYKAMPSFCGNGTSPIGVGDKIKAVPENVARLRRAIILFGAAFCLVALFIPPFFSTDVYCYGNIGWQQVHYGCNPYVYSPSDVPGWKSDPLFFASWENAPSVYGFLFSMLCSGVAWLANGNRALATLIFKLINIAVFAGTAWLVWRGSKRFGRSNPEQALYLFLWNPLLLLHFVADAHNDLLMGLSNMTGLFCAILGGWLFAPASIICGALIKYVSVILMPFLSLYLLKRFGFVKTATGLIVGAVFFVVTAAPYLTQDWRHLSLDRIATTLSEWRNYTLAAFLFYPFDVLANLFPSLEAYCPSVKLTIKQLLLTGFAAFYLRLFWTRLHGMYDADKLLHDSVLVSFLLVCFINVKFYPWYLGMMLPLAYWLPPDSRLRRAVQAVACAQVLQFTFIREAAAINTVVLLLAPLAYAWRAQSEKNAAETNELEEVAIPIRQAA